MVDSVSDEHSGGMTSRIKRILLTPKTEWRRIDAEPMTVGGILRGWVMPLAAIGPVAGLIGSFLFGFSFFGIGYRPSLAGAFVTALFGYIMAIVGVFVLAFLINALASSFDGTPNRVQAMKVAGYAATAGYLAGIFQLFPLLAFLGLLGLYSLYLFWVGLPILMRVPEAKAAGYAIVTIIAAMIVYVVAGLIAGALSAAVVPRAMTGFAGHDGAVSGKLTIPGAGSVDLGKLDAASKRLEAASRNGTTTPPVDTDRLAAMLPAAIHGFTKGDVETSSTSAGNFGGSHARATYGNGDQHFRLSVTDMGAVGALSALGGAFNVKSSKTTADGYERTQMVDGRMVSEKWRGSSKRGSYGVMVAERFMVEAQGTAPDIDTLKDAVTSIDYAGLESLAKQ